ncbi:hypothetical protein B0H67DRAFT_641030 [Lasiosphaeris hirsuta]|uniref:Uncharacterized protein n=1 Tax=Lasiosphaeris hirsuta TaxID=260670 RepID=A0AA40E495_9PEZI|nr:hypothetical protein B0H67DRAFT_641030 [Lasiosphaeris hirsuta]
MADDFSLVPLPASLRKRFYEPVVFFTCISDIFAAHNSTEIPEQETVVPRSPKQTFVHFVNKLGQICDNKRGGNTVTAFAVLQPGVIEYRFASNRRSRESLENVQAYVASILEILSPGQASDAEVSKADDQSKLFERILRVVLDFNRLRVEYYARTLVQQLDFCIENSAIQNTAEGDATSKDLRALKPLAIFANQRPKVSKEEFVDKSVTLLRAIDGRYPHGGPLERFIRAKSNKDRTGPSENPWANVDHALGRLLSYFVAIKILISARREWPMLFEDFSVVAVRSSQPDPKPPAIAKSAEKIIKRMTNQRSVIDAYHQHASNLQQWGLDTRIKEKAEANFTPIVHAELLLLDSILRSEQANLGSEEETPRFWNEAEFGRYIGCSKPTCHLCALYIEEHRKQCIDGGVQVRPSHHNVYSNWRAPDVFAKDGKEAETRRNQVLEQVVKGIRALTFKAIRERSVFRNPFDSNNTPSDPTRTTNHGASMIAIDGSALAQEEEGNDLVSRMSRLGIGLGHGDGNSSRATAARPVSVQTVYEEILDAQVGRYRGGRNYHGQDDDEEGGATL